MTRRWSFVRRHVCRLDPFPPPLQRTIEITARSPAYEVMWGRNQFLLTGNLRGCDRRSEVGRVQLPTLVSCGRYDKFVPACSRELHQAIPGSELHVFEQSSHMSHLEEPKPFSRCSRRSSLARKRRLRSRPRSDLAAHAYPQWRPGWRRRHPPGAPRGAPRSGRSPRRRYEPGNRARGHRGCDRR
jgi:hypothetical protein